MVSGEILSRTLEYYESHASELSVRYESADLSSFHRSLASYLQRGTRILEIGCGSGRDAALAMAGGFDVVAIDGSAKLLAEAERLHSELKGRLFCQRLPGRLPFADGEFDGFYSVACFMHFVDSDIVDILKELWRVTASGARGIISVPSCRSDIDNDGVDEHGRVFNVMPVAGWRALFARSGFSAEAGTEEPDSLGRHGVSWVSFLLEKTG